MDHQEQTPEEFTAAAVETIPTELPAGELEAIAVARYGPVGYHTAAECMFALLCDAAAAVANSHRGAGQPRLDQLRSILAALEESLAPEVAARP
ncbi:MAG TPA: hypothetical protein VGG75_14890 [Trebonia sp.]|jgi:hypothetical protein